MEPRPNIPTNCFFHACTDPSLEAQIRKTKDICFRYNQLHPNDMNARRAVLSTLLGTMGEDVTIMSAFWCDYGYNIHMGSHVYANHNLVITDGARVDIGDHVFIGPNCCITTAEHAIDPEMRKAGIEVAKPIKIGNNVWIGAGSTILAGVEIGDNSVIGAGSVVTKAIPANVVAVGVPCGILRPISEADRSRYPLYGLE